MSEGTIFRSCHTARSWVEVSDRRMLGVLVTPATTRSTSANAHRTEMLKGNHHCIGDLRLQLLPTAEPLDCTMDQIAEDEILDPDFKAFLEHQFV